MSKLYFKYGTMGSSKTAQALITKFNYEEKGKRVWLIKPATDTRDDNFDADGNRINIIKSRIGLIANTAIIKETDNIYEEFLNQGYYDYYDVVITDECQFFTEKQINQLRRIVNDFNIPVFCYGLRSDFKTNLFSGSKRLFEIADSISEIKSICKCGHKTIINARIDEIGNVVTDGTQILLGGNEKYESMCTKCYYEKIFKNSAK